MAALLLILASIFAELVGYYPLDWRNYMLAASQLMMGASPYGSVEFFGPPWLSIALIPLALIPGSLSSALWLVLLVVAIFFSSVIWMRYADYPSTPFAQLLLSVVSVLLPAALFVYITGQITPIVELAFIWIAIYTIKGTNRQIIALVVASFLITSKPHIVVFPILFVLLESIRKGMWRVPITFSATILVAGIAALLILPSWPNEWLAAIADGDYLGGPGLVARSYYGLRDAGVSGYLLLLPAIYTLYYWKRSGLTATTIALSLASGLLFIPYVRPYDYIILWPSIITASGLWKQKGHRILQGLPIVVFMLLPVTSFSVLMPALAMGFLLLGIAYTGEMTEPNGRQDA
jgi:hypothetical protein